MTLPLGKPIGAMFLITLIAGAYIALRPRAPRADQAIWLFADDHARLARTGESHRATQRR